HFAARLRRGHEAHALDAGRRLQGATHLVHVLFADVRPQVHGSPSALFPALAHGVDVHDDGQRRRQTHESDGHAEHAEHVQLQVGARGAPSSLGDLHATFSLSTAASSFRPSRMSVARPSSSTTTRRGRTSSKDLSWVAKTTVTPVSWMSSKSPRMSTAS